MKGILIYISFVFFIISCSEKRASISTNDIANSLLTNVYCIYQGTSGDIWFGLECGGACRFDGKNFTGFTRSDGLCNNTVNSILQDKNGTFWFGTSDGISCYDGKSFKSFTTKDNLGNNFICNILEDRSGNLWFGTDGRYVSGYDGKTFHNYKIPLPEEVDPSYSPKFNLCEGRILSMIQDRNGNQWFAVNKKACRFNGKSFKYLTDNESFNNSLVTTMLEDKSGNLWFGTEDSGTFCFNGKSFVNYTSKEGLCTNSVSCIAEDRKGNIWFGTSGGVNRYDADSFTKYTTKEGLCSNQVQCILADKSGNIIVGTNDGVCYFNGHGFINFASRVPR